MGTGAPSARTRRQGRGWVALALFEIALAAAAVLADLLVPTVVLLALAVLSLLARREGWWSLGVRRLARLPAAAAQIGALTVGWTAVQLALIMPVVERLTGERQDLSQFDDLQGNLAMLLALLAVSWTLAAVGEEVAYRGYVFTRMVDVLGSSTTARWVAIGLSSALFAAAHTEQGAVGVALTFFDALFFSVLRDRYASLWAPVLAHGFNNTLGLTAYFVIGPVYALW
jgi:hypothetical protein